MAQNRRPEEQALEGSSSAEEEGSSEENEEQEESESESEEDKAPTPMAKKPSTPKKPETTQTSAQPQSSSTADSGSESESESDSPPNTTRRVDPNIKPIASKPMEEPPKATTKPRSKPSFATPGAKSTAPKRAVERENSNRESKKAKRKAADADEGVEEDTAKKTGDDAKKQLFQRLWSEDDEIVILKGIIDYTAKKGADPLAEMSAFHDFIKKSLHVEVSKTQLSDKVRRLRKKYSNNASKGKKGEDRTFSKPHEQKAYEWSKKIWGGEANGVGFDNSKVNGKARKNPSQRATTASPKVDGVASPDRAKEGTKMEVESNTGVSRSVRFNRSIGESIVEEEIIKDGLEWISGPKKLELQEKWKHLRVEEVELYLKRVDLIREQTKLVLEALKSSGQ